MVFIFKIVETIVGWFILMTVGATLVGMSVKGLVKYKRMKGTGKVLVGR